jgi:hypothetical protein
MSLYAQKGAGTKTYRAEEMENRKLNAVERALYAALRYISKPAFCTLLAMVWLAGRKFFLPEQVHAVDVTVSGIYIAVCAINAFVAFTIGHSLATSEYPPTRYNDPADSDEYDDIPNDTWPVDGDVTVGNTILTMAPHILNGVACFWVSASEADLRSGTRIVILIAVSLLTACFRYYRTCRE